MTNLKITDKQLGAGGYGTAYVAIDPMNNKKYAVKIFNEECGLSNSSV